MVPRLRSWSAAWLSLAGLTACQRDVPGASPPARAEAAAPSGSFASSAPSSPSAASVAPGESVSATKRYDVAGLTVEVGLYPASSAFVLGEPVYLTFRVKNLLSMDVYTDHMSGTTDVFGRRERFGVTVTTAGGARVHGPQDDPLAGGGNAADGPEKIAPGATWETQLLLADSATITAAGRYHVRCRYVLGLGSSMATGSVETANHTLVEVGTDVEILPADAAALGRVIDAYARAAANVDPQVGDTPSLHAVRALGLIDDPRVVPPLARSAMQGTYAEKFAALHALSARHSGALDAIVAALHDADPNIVDTAAAALVLSKDPRAVDALWDARVHGSEAVRARLVSALEQTKDATSTARLREMTRDPSPAVKKEARRALAARARTP